MYRVLHDQTVSIEYVVYRVLHDQTVSIEYFVYRVLHDQTVSIEYATCEYGIGRPPPPAAIPGRTPDRCL